jgi:hypothetical protein
MNRIDNDTMVAAMMALRDRLESSGKAKDRKLAKTITRTLEGNVSPRDIVALLSWANELNIAKLKKQVEAL